MPGYEPSVHWVYSKNVSFVCLVGILDLGTVLAFYCCGETPMAPATLAYGLRGLVCHGGTHDKGVGGHGAGGAGTRKRLKHTGPSLSIQTLRGYAQ